MNGNLTSSNGNGHSDPKQSNGDDSIKIKHEESDDFKPVFQKTWQYYPALFLTVSVWSVTPLSWFMILNRIYHLYQSSFQFSSMSVQDYLFFWTATSNGYPISTFPLNILWYHALMEIPFSIYLFFLNRKAQRKLDPPELDNRLLVGLLIQCLEVGTRAHPPQQNNSLDDVLENFVVTDQEARLAWSRFRKWFHYAKKSDIKADNVREWLAWAFAGRTLEECRSDHHRSELVEKGLSLVQSRLKHQFPPGYNPKAKALRLTLDPVPTLSRPIGYYIVCNGATLLVYRYMKKNGFKFVSDGQCEFLVLPAKRKSTRSSNLPIVFLHGLGIGLGQYYAFIRHLKNHQDGVIVLLQPNISALIWHKHYLNVPNNVEHVRAIKSVMGRNGFDKATILSHSNGTMVHGWLARGAPEICGKHVLTDPVCFRLWEAKTCYTFIARPWATGIEVLLGYFVSTEIGVATTIARRFQWTEMALWTHDFNTLDPNKLQIIFGEHDLLVDVPACLEYLLDSGVPHEAIHVCPKAQHGKCLFLDSLGMDLVRTTVGLNQPQPSK